jgi:hypothetical protein
LANSETALRTEIVQAFKKIAFTQVISQRFSAGMPDLLVCWLGDVWFLELKFSKSLFATPLIGLTDLQRSWIRRYQDAGGNAAWVLGAQDTVSSWRLWAGVDSKQERAMDFDLATTRRRGVLWDVRALMDFLSLRREERGR